MEEICWRGHLSVLAAFMKKFSAGADFFANEQGTSSISFYKVLGVYT